MKKHLVVLRTENGLIETYIFSELSGRELKKNNENILTVVSTERVSHPSPEILVESLKANGYDVAKFYATCFEIATAKENEQENEQ